MIIRKMTASDWDRVREIYEEGIATGHATFETQAPTWERWDAKHLPNGRLVAAQEDAVLGWAALSPVSDRCVYAGVAEVSIYVAANTRGSGVGRHLLSALVAASEEAGIWTLQAGIFPENGASLRIHADCGFRVVGQRERLGQLLGQWRNALLLERRSSIVGI